ncbi:IS630 family transposase [Methylobacterium sp. P31]
MSKERQPNNLDALDRALALASENSDLHRKEKAALIFMARMAWSNSISRNRIMQTIAEQDRVCFQKFVEPGLTSRSEIYRKRALTLTFCLAGIPSYLVAEFMFITTRQMRRLLLRLRRCEYNRLISPPTRAYRHENKEIRDHLFRIMHAPPNEYNINRTTWTVDLLHDVLMDEGVLVGKNTICRIIRDEGYVFRKTREVLTSNDPDYKEKLRKITRTLRRLGPMDRFFSIDEYGPVSVRERGGRRRARRGEKPTIPQYQLSKGTITVTAALELSSNQITHFYSQKKGTAEMIKLLYCLLNQYRGCRRLYLSWDAASWHSSRAFLAEIKRVNRRNYRKMHETPTVRLKPLPARAQFLNVIESVFSGMAKSVIHNSNYRSADEMKAAIDRYFSERNEHFRINLHRAGNKIWGEEQVPSYFSVSHNCKSLKIIERLRHTMTQYYYKTVDCCWASSLGSPGRHHDAHPIQTGQNRCSIQRS